MSACDASPQAACCDTAASKNCTIVEACRMIHAPNWRLRMEKDGVRCFTQAFPPCSKEGTMLTFFVPGIRAKDAEAFFEDDAREFEHDRLLREKKLLSDVATPPGRKLYYKRWASPVSSLIVKPRDMVVEVTPATYLTREDQNVLGVTPKDPPEEPTVFVHCGCDKKDSYPLQDGYVRGTLHLYAYVVAEERGGVDVTVVFLVDPSGYVPSALYNAFAHHSQVQRFVVVRHLLAGSSEPLPVQSPIACEAHSDEASPEGE